MKNLKIVVLSLMLLSLNVHAAQPDGSTRTDDDVYKTKLEKATPIPKDKAVEFFKQHPYWTMHCTMSAGLSESNTLLPFMPPGMKQDPNEDLRGFAQILTYPLGRTGYVLALNAAVQLQGETVQLLATSGDQLLSCTAGKDDSCTSFYTTATTKAENGMNVDYLKSIGFELIPSKASTTTSAYTLTKVNEDTIIAKITASATNSKYTSWNALTDSMTVSPTLLCELTAAK